MLLATKKCVPCDVGAIPLDRNEAGELLKQTADWVLSEDARKISKNFKFKNFKEALLFVNKVGAIAEVEGHHPDITLEWGKVSVELSTHSIGGLSENDFIVAAKIGAL